jgi:hypothetical protein
MNNRAFMLLALVGTVTSSSFALGIGSSKINDLTFKGRTVGVRFDSPELPPSSGGSPSVDTTCNFVGLANNDSVNDAYAGGTSSSGVSRTNLGIRFTGATVLTSWNGCCSPDANIAWAPNGTIVLGSSSANSYWSAVDFSVCSTVTLTVQSFASTDGSGTALETFSVAGNITGAPFSTWTAKHLVLAQAARSVKITGTAGYWGIDTVSKTVRTPLITSVTPNTGTQFGGTQITVAGAGFTGATAVTIGGVAATGLSVSSDSQLTAVPPFSATAGAKDVVVTTPAGPRRPRARSPTRHPRPRSRSRRTPARAPRSAAR